MFIFAQPHQDPGSAVLYVLELLDALARDPDECIAVIQPGGDKGVDELLCICLGECRPEFGNVVEVVECGLAEVIDLGVIVQLLHFNTQVGDRCGRGDVLARESDTGDVGGAELMWVPMRMASVVGQFN